MSVVTDTTIGGGIITLDKRVNRRVWNLAQNIVGKKRTQYTREVRKDLPIYSHFGECADAYALLTDGEKAAWNSAGALCGMSGYNLFIQDKTFRICNEIAGNATPSNNHQYLVGHLNLPVGSGHCLFRQVGNDIFSGDSLLQIYYKASLQADGGGGGYVKARFRQFYMSGGSETSWTDEITLSLSTDWAYLWQEVSVMEDQTGHWELEIECDLLKGDLWFDNLYVAVADVPLTKDPYCNEVEKRFNMLIMPGGVTFQSTYPAD